MKKHDPEYYRQAKIRQRQRMLNFLGGKCVLCASTDELQVDHIDPSKKKFSINSRMSLKNPDVIAELLNCQILCGSCHRLKTSGEQRGFTHGTFYGWVNVGCSCEKCSEAKRTWYDDRNARRRALAVSGRRKYRRERSHGTTTMYRYGCRCDLCRSSNIDYLKKKRASGGK